MDDRVGVGVGVDVGDVLGCVFSEVVSLFSDVLLNSCCSILLVLNVVFMWLVRFISVSEFSFRVSSGWLCVILLVDIVSVGVIIVCNCCRGVFMLLSVVLVCGWWFVLLMWLLMLFSR